MSNIRYFGTWQKIVNSKMLRENAKETGFQQRRRGKLDGPRFFWATVLGGRVENKRTMAGMARAASIYSGEKVSRQAFHQRMTFRAVAFMESTLQKLMWQSVTLTGDPLPGMLGKFDDVNAIDSTTIRLANQLARLYPACRSNVRKSALKIHAQMSLTDKQVEWLQLTAERVHDRKGMVEIGPWVKDRLLLFDLGYADYGLFGEIVRYGGAFLTRLKESANGIIVGVRRGCAKRHIGREMNRSIYDDTVVDMDVQFGSGAKSVVLRVVGIWNHEKKDFHWYVTSLPPSDFSPKEIAEIYRLRWQVELLFKIWKSVCRLDQLPSEKEEVILCLVYASLCAALLSRIASWLAARCWGVPWHQMCASLALQLLAHYAFTLGKALLCSRRSQLHKALSEFIKFLAVHARLPNRTNAVMVFANDRN
jgi:putative transposase